MAAWRDMGAGYDRDEALGEALGYGWYYDDLEAELNASITAATILCDAIDAVAAEGHTSGSSPARRHCSTGNSLPEDRLHAGSSPVPGVRRDDHNPGSAVTPREGAAAASRRFYPDVTKEA